MFPIIQSSPSPFLLPLYASKLGSMAIRCPSSLHIRIPSGDVIKKPSTPKAWVFPNSSHNTPPNRKTVTSITCFNNKVFEDESKGIICYKDENGELICEGYDEGPRFRQQNLQNVYYQRELEIPEFFSQSMIQTTEGIEFQCIKVSVKEEGFDCKDLNGKSVF